MKTLLPLCALSVCLLLPTGQAGAQESAPPAGGGERPTPRPIAPPEATPARPQTPTPDTRTTALTPPPAAGRTGASALPRSRAPEMLGDQAPIVVGGPTAPGPTPPLPAPPTPATPGAPGAPGTPGRPVPPAPAPAVVIPGTRYFKIADNESPRPQDRAYFSFNFYDDLNGPLNRRTGVDLRDVRAFRETFGLEKTVGGGVGSFGLRLPLNTFSADSADPTFGRTSTALGDLSFILKYALWRDPDNDDWFSAGLAVTPPTGSDSFAGLDRESPFHRTTLQPFVGGLHNAGDWYLQGFAAVDVPMHPDDVTLLYTDLGVGWFLYRSPCPDRLVTAVAPTLEVHVTTPLNHRGSPGPGSPAGFPDAVDLTGGVNVELCRRARLAVGVATPVTGPRLFDVEVLAQLRWSF